MSRQVKPQSAGQRAVALAIRRFVKAKIADSWKGAQHTDDHESIEHELTLATNHLAVTLERYVP